MHCFNHKSKNSIGTCKNCQKGLCQDCIELVKDMYISCKEDICKIRIVEEQDTIERSKKICGIGKYKSRRPTTLSMFFLSFGIIIGGEGLFKTFFSAKTSFDIFSLSIGVVFLLFGTYLTLRKDKLSC
jgi:hypothetical protein